jgi:predicted permease
VGRIRAWIVRVLLRDDLARLQREVQEEFRFHIEMKTSALVRRGMDPEAARAFAEDCFGDSHALLQAGVRNLSSARRTERRRRGLQWLVQDFRDGARRLTRHPAYALLAAGTLALGLSTSTAVFTYVNAYGRPFPGASVKGVYQLFQSGEAVAYGPISYPDYQDLAGAAGERFRAAASGQPLFAASVRHETLTEVVFGQGVTGDFFPLLRVEMEQGRGLSPDDDRPGAPPVVVISYEYWVRRYGAAADVLGRTIYLNNRPHTIVGVAGPSFLGSRSSFRPQVWMPFEHFKAVYWARSDTESNRETGAVAPYLRLGPGWSEGAAERFLEAFASNLDQEAPLAGRSRRFSLEPATWIHPGIREAELPTTRIMVAAAAALLLLACANMANLVLSAGVRRGREMALRAAVGASRGRLVRQLLAENLILSILAGGLGLAVAGPAANRISSYFASPSVWGANVPRVITVDPRVMGFAVLVAVITGMVTGLVPALKTSGADLASRIRSGGRGHSETVPAGRPRLLGTRDLLVSVQVALSVVLLFVASLVLRTLRSAADLDPGFNTRETLASYVSTSSMGTPVAERKAFFRDLIQRFEEFSWVRAATVS